MWDVNSSTGHDIGIPMNRTDADRNLGSAR
ncbi:hypothetical protein SAMN06272789_7110 [Streptomyces sp. 1331.2]|nr:hypothetical protein SAMN06272789_7110 [Streptomyces sp. 1331.2]